MIEAELTQTPMRPPAAAVIPRWFAVTVKPQHEKVAACALRQKGLEEFLPLYRARRQWSDRVKTLELPLFPGYVFCRFPALRKSVVLATPGVRRIVGFGGVPTPLEDAEIESIRAMITSGFGVGPWPYLRTGQRVRIEAGPLRGLEGLLVSLKDCWRVVVSLHLLQRSVAVEVERDMVRPVG
ncbi:MAG TPA: UpxY family transcription antiterminator [Bryobacteraceae bacterium]|nr:UpxY family transcription antiterminator [Bryobacteraceae bacterium]